MTMIAWVDPAEPMGVVTAFTLSGASSALVYRAGFLTLPAACLASLMGFSILFAGGLPMASAAALGFLATSLLSMRRDRLERRSRSRSHAKRNHRQMLANGLVPSILALLVGISVSADAVLEAAYFGGLAAVAGDTWASAVASHRATVPRSITSGRPVPAGSPGAVTGFGFLLAAVAGVTISGAGIVVAALLVDVPISARRVVALTGAAAIGGVTGSIVDSWLGATCQARYLAHDHELTESPRAADGSPNRLHKGLRWLDNDVVNFVSSVVGASSAAAALVVLDAN